MIPVDDYFPGLKSTEALPTVMTDSLGRFKFSFTSTDPNFYQIISNNYHLLKADIFIEPKDSIYIEQSSWSAEPKFVIGGKGSEKLRHLEKDFSILPKDKLFYEKISGDHFTTELEFKRFIDSIHFERVNALNSFSSIPKVVKKYHLNTLEAERAAFLLEHLERRNYYTHGEFGYFFPDKTYYTFLDSIDFNNDFSKTTSAKLLAGKYLTDKAQLAFKNRNEEEWWKENLNWKLNFIAHQPKSAWKDLMALSTISEYSFGLMADDFFDYLKLFEENMQNHFSSDFNRNRFELNIASYKQLQPGSQAPDFELPDSNGILHKLSDFQGKIVYIDFWGTWCYPCIEEIPDALSLQEKYKDRPVIFIYIALENSSEINRWKEFIAGNNQRFGKFLDNKPFPGIHLVAENQFRNEAIKDYKINFAPTHVLIDQNGEIVKARAKRSKDIHEEIDKLLNQ
ncbi:Thiol:disulfide oxidoreductase [Indibacter alkaliphilus LW1]|uniref:Thiol:disulfide oxidoreductase n=1 Tax=Indibacter alkaliphilus (strain CCUG 57479 / KCTC 22604 / LW1) TaxID=1189612 RepID=S2DIC6_INDAL|nr:Thiol:disulfide oxidoreductase [Indibacter alkaliphilus LW1]